MPPADTPWLVRALPATRRLFAGKSAAGAVSSDDALGIVWAPGPGRDGAGTAALPLLILLSDRPAMTAWLASSIAVLLPAVVLVVASDDSGSPALVDTALSRCEQWGADPSRIGVIGEDAGASAALTLSTHTAVSRLALVSPRLLAPLASGPVPPTLLQFARAGESSGATVALERTLRARGTAVRATDYTTLGDGWARYPRAVRGSDRGLEDLLGFLRRGFGTDSTFHVIPGWDLH